VARGGVGENMLLGFAFEEIMAARIQVTIQEIKN